MQNTNNNIVLKKLNKVELLDQEGGYEEYFDIINNLDEDDKITDGRCKFCKSEFRDDAEREWEQRKSFKAVMDFLNKNGENMNINNIRTHIRNHYLRQEQIILRRHYSERILSVINAKISKMKRIDILLGMLEDKAWKYASIEHENDAIAAKNDDMLIKIVKEIGGLLKVQAELEGDLKPAQVVIEKFQQIFVSAINKIDDPKIKMEMVKELEHLKEVSEVTA